MNDEQLLLSIQDTLSDVVTLNMGEVNDAYLLILKRYHVEVDETTHYRKHLKQFITEHLPNAQFVKSFRKHEPDNSCLPKTVSKAMEIRLLTVFGRTMLSGSVLRNDFTNWEFGRCSLMSCFRCLR